MRPLARLLAPLTVAVYTVLGVSNVADGKVSDAIDPLESSVTVPVGATQGDAQVKVKPVAAAIGAIGSLKCAVTTVVLSATPVALLAGATDVTVGATMMGTGGAGWVTGAPFNPNMGAWLPPLHPARTMPASNAHNQGMPLVKLFAYFIFIP